MSLRERQGRKEAYVFGIGDTEFFLIVLFAFLMFGPDKLPGMGRTIGRALRQFRTAQEGMSKVVQSEIIDPIQNVADTPKGKAAARSQAEDEDLTEEEVAAAKPQETFAERRARLAKERAAKEQKKGAAGAEAEKVADAGEGTSEEDEAANQTPAAEPEQPEMDPTSVAALYGLDDDEADEDEAANAAGADTDAADSDSDADVDTDTDSDPDADTDSDTDTDADTDADADSDADAPAKSDEEDA